MSISQYAAAVVWRGHICRSQASWPPFQQGHALQGCSPRAPGIHFPAGGITNAPISLPLALRSSSLTAPLHQSSITIRRLLQCMDSIQCNRGRVATSGSAGCAAHLCKLNPGLWKDDRNAGIRAHTRQAVIQSRSVGPLLR